MMPRLWLFQQSVEGLSSYVRLAERSASGSLISNLGEVFNHAAQRGAAPVPPRLSIQDDTFNLDLFDEGVMLVSSRLIETMALPPEVAEIGEVDDRTCSDAVKSLGYRTLRLLVRADVLDHRASEGSVVKWIDPEGAAKAEWILAAPAPNKPTPRARWRSDFEPPADLFLANGTPWRVATDALATRVLRSGAIGIDFVDAMASAAVGDLVTKRHNLER